MSINTGTWVILSLNSRTFLSFRYRKKYTGNSSPNSKEEDVTLRKITLMNFEEAREFSSYDTLETFGTDFEIFAI